MGNKISKHKPSIDLNAAKIKTQCAGKHIASPSESFSTITARLSANTSSSKLTPSSFTPHNPISVHSSFPSTLPVRLSIQKRDSSLIKINNGVTGTYISYKITRIASKFWQANLVNLRSNETLEIACALYFCALASDNAIMKDVMRAQFSKKQKSVKQIALKYLDMIAWLIRCLGQDNLDLYTVLAKLGVSHRKMGIKIIHFGPLLQSLHDTLSHYFPKKYTIEVKYAIDEIFTLSAQIMTGQDLQCSPHLNAITRSFERENNIDFLRNLEICLKSGIGREYLYRYLQQTFCDEIAVFLQILSKFKSQLSGVQRFMVARDIVRMSIAPNADLTINISYDCRQNILIAMHGLERQFKSKEIFVMDCRFFDECEREIYKLISENHWTVFVRNIKELHSKSFRH